MRVAVFDSSHLNHDVSHRRLVETAASVGVGRAGLTEIAKNVAHDLDTQRAALWSSYIPGFVVDAQSYAASDDLVLFDNIQQGIDHVFQFVHHRSGWLNADQLLKFVGDTFADCAVGPILSASFPVDLPPVLQDFLLTAEERLCSDIATPNGSESDDGGGLNYWRMLVQRPAQALQMSVAKVLLWNQYISRTWLVVVALTIRLKQLYEAVLKTVGSPGKLLVCSRHVTRGPSTSWMTSVLVIHGGALGRA